MVLQLVLLLKNINVTTILNLLRLNHPARIKINVKNANVEVKSMMQVQRIRVVFIWAIPIIVVGTPGRGQNTGWEGGGNPRKTGKGQNRGENY